VSVDRHHVDPTSLVFGLLFVVVGQMLLIGDPDTGTVWLGWTGPAVALGLGILIVLAVRPRRSSAGADDGRPVAEDSDLNGRPAADDV
jgi:cytochrome c-type biogenesis protein CcmH/NrfF